MKEKDVERQALARYFPMLRSREEILERIGSRSELKDQFMQWNSEEQKTFLDFCSGARGVKVIYDGFLKRFLIRRRFRNGWRNFYRCFCKKR